MKSLMQLLWEVLDELGTWCHVSTTADYEYVCRRVESEGDEFLTISLPGFADDFEYCLKSGQTTLLPADGDGETNMAFVGFKKRGELPVFLGGFLDLIFDRELGSLRDEPSVDAIFAVRQICLMFGKVYLPCTPARVAKALQKYVTCEKELSLFAEEFQSVNRDVDRQDFRRIARLLWKDVLTKMDHTIYELDVLPKHGPGATADRLRGNAKYGQIEWTQRLEEVFPAGEFLLPNWRYREVLDRVKFLEPGAERPVKVITVPKTLKTPRIIAVEPTCMQYAQQAILTSLVPAIENDKLVGQLVGFSDQVPNRRMAEKGSLDGSLATLDLSEASDRVSNLHVQLLCEDWPWFSKALDATRSRKADVPGHGIISLSKFASMGSAVCFPVEAMVFLTVVIIGIERSLNENRLSTRGEDRSIQSGPISRRDVRSLVGKVRVYGDDIVVPREHAFHVIRALEAFGFLVNKDKTATDGYFRESCGAEFYRGHDVSIVRVRELLPTSRGHVPEIVSTVSMRNQFYWKGMWRTAAFLDGVIGRLIPYPTVSETSPVLGRHSLLGYETQRMCQTLHRPLVKGAVVKTRLPKSNLRDSDALLKVLLRAERRGDPDPVLGDEPIADKHHLERAGRPEAVDIKLRWAPPF